MNSRYMLLFAVAAMLVASGCSQASVKTPVAGDIPKMDSDAIEALKGQWSGDGYLMATRVKDPANAILELAFLSVEKDEIHLERTEAYIRETPAGLVASYKRSGDTDYTFVRFTPGKNWIAIFPPNVDAIRGAVRTGTLKGNIAQDQNRKEDQDVILERLGPEDFARAEKAGLPPATLFHGIRP